MAGELSVSELLCLNQRLTAELAERAHRGFDPSRMTLQEILRAQAALSRELLRRGVARTAADSSWDAVAHMLCRSHGWRRERDHALPHHAMDERGSRIRIHVRRVTGVAAGDAFAPIRGLEEHGFDALAAVALDEDYGIARAALLSRAAVAAKAEPLSEPGSFALRLSHAFAREETTQDLTPSLRTWIEPQRRERRIRDLPPRGATRGLAAEPRAIEPTG